MFREAGPLVAFVFASIVIDVAPENVPKAETSSWHTHLGLFLVAFIKGQSYPRALLSRALELNATAANSHNPIGRT